MKLQLHVLLLSKVSRDIRNGVILNLILRNFLVLSHSDGLNDAKFLII